MTLNKKISDIKKFLLEECNKNNNLFSRFRKISFKDLFYFLINLVGDNSSFSSITSLLNIDNIVDVSKQSISKRLSLINSSTFDKLIDKTIGFIKKENILEKQLIYAVDGSKLSFDKDCSSYGFKLTKNKKYCKCLLSNLYDINNKLCIKMKITKHSDERRAFVDHLIDYIPKNSIVLFDRGYQSEGLMRTLVKNKIKFVIRAKVNDLDIKFMIKNNLDTYFKVVDGVGGVKIVKYIIDNKAFYLLTNIFDQPIEYFQNLYHERWYVEEYFKTLKKDLKSNNYNCKSPNKNEQQLYAQQLITLVSRYLELLANKYNPHNVRTNKNNKNHGTYKINHKNTLNVVIKRTFYMILYKKSIKKIVRCILIIENTKVYIQPGRKCKRLRIKPTSKWYYLGITMK